MQSIKIVENIFVTGCVLEADIRSHCGWVVARFHQARPKLERFWVVVAVFAAFDVVVSCVDSAAVDVVALWFQERVPGILLLVHQTNFRLVFGLRFWIGFSMVGEHFASISGVIFP